MWQWYSIVFLTGAVLGSIAAWRANATRVFIRTLGLPLALILLRTLLPNTIHGTTSLLPLIGDYALLVVSAILGDYSVGLKLGRHDAKGYRDDAVGH